MKRQSLDGYDDENQLTVDDGTDENETAVEGSGLVKKRFKNTVDGATGPAKRLDTDYIGPEIVEDKDVTEVRRLKFSRKDEERSDDTELHRLVPPKIVKQQNKERLVAAMSSFGPMPEAVSEKKPTPPNPADDNGADHKIEESWHMRDQITRGNLDKSLNVNVEIARLVDATMKMDNPPAEFYKKIDTKEVERASLDERLHQLGGPAGSNNLLQFPVASPKFKDVYRKSVLEVHRAMTKNPDGPESRVAFRNLIDSIVVHPTAKRMPYEFTPYARLAAMQGLNLFPSYRTTKEVVAAQGLSCSDKTNTGKSVSS